MRQWVLILLLSAAPGAGGDAHGQSAPARGDGADPARGSTSDEVIVRGRRLTDLRFEVEVAQERAYAIFNEINSDDDFDVHCREERRYHSRATVRNCRAQFESRISGEATKAYLAELHWTCQPSTDAFSGVQALNTQACLFGGSGQTAAAAARALEGQLPTKHEQMKDEIVRLANQDHRFAQAILDWYEKTQQYDTARRRRAVD